MKKRYVAKISNNLGRLHEYELSPRYQTIEEQIKRHLNRCLFFIKKPLEVLYIFLI